MVKLLFIQYSGVPILQYSNAPILQVLLFQFSLKRRFPLLQEGAHAFLCIRTAQAKPEMIALHLASPAKIRVITPINALLHGPQGYFALGSDEMGCLYGLFPELVRREDFVDQP